MVNCDWYDCTNKKAKKAAHSSRMTRYRVRRAVVTSSTESLARPQHRRQWSMFTLAVTAWLLVSPWILGYGGETRMVVNDLIAAIVPAALSLGPPRHRGFVT